MQNRKNIIIPISIIAILLGLLAIFNPFKISTTNNGVSSSSTSSSGNTTSVKPIAFKDNKTIELEPVQKENWNYNINKFEPSDYTLSSVVGGLPGTVTYTSPKNTDNNQITLNILNTNLPTSKPEDTTMISDYVKGVKDLSSLIVDLNTASSDQVKSIYKLYLPFVQNLNIPTTFKKEIAYEKPSNIQEMKVFMSEVSNGNITDRILNIIGKVGNDYFFLQNNLSQSLKVDELYKQYSAECGDVPVECITSKIYAQLDKQITPELIDSNIKSSLAQLKLQN